MAAGQHVLTHQVGSTTGLFRPMSNEHVSMWTASVYTVHVTMFPRGSACVYIVHVVKTSIRNYFANPTNSCFEFRVYGLLCVITLCAFYLNELNRNIII